MTDSPISGHPFDYLTPEAKARVEIDKMLTAAGWAVQDADKVNLAAARGVAVREFILTPPHGRVDYLLFVDREAVGLVEAKAEGETLTGVAWQTAKYVDGLPDEVPTTLEGPLPFAYQSTGAETRFTNGLDPDSRSREVFWFHRPETMADWIREYHDSPLAPTLRQRLAKMPAADLTYLWPPKDIAVKNLELSLAQNKPRALIQMATGSGKTLLAAYTSYRLIKFANAHRVLFLVDRANLGRQTLKEFQSFTTPDDGRKFTELYNVQHLNANVIDPVARVTITTIQRLFSILKGEAELDPELDEHSTYDLLPSAPVPVDYNPKIPIETFDVIIVDECHRSIYGLWRQVLDYFDAFIVGLTATPNKQAFGFFNQNLVMEYTHEQAVADQVNVDFDVYRIRTEIFRCLSHPSAERRIRQRVEIVAIAGPERPVTTIKASALSLPAPGTPRADYSQAERLGVAVLKLVAAYALRLVSGDRSRAKVVLFDEAWFLLASSDGRRLVDRLNRLGRAENAALLLATQQLGDVGEIENLIGARFIFGQETPAEAERALALLGLDPGDHELVQRLRGYRRGRCLFRDLDDRIAEVQIDLVDPALLAALDTTPGRAPVEAA